MAEKQKKHKLNLGGGAPGGTPIPDDVAQSNGNVDVIHGVYAHSLPLAGMTVKQARKELVNKMNIDPQATAVVDGTEVGDDTALAQGQVLTFVKPAGEKGMTDKITLSGTKLVIETDEGKKVERPVTLLDDMYRSEFVPLSDGIAYPDGTKFIEHRGPLMLVAHQRPPHVRQARWIAPNSPADFGSGTKYGKLRLSFPYSLTLALFQRTGDKGQYSITARNELYFSNTPIIKKDSVVCYPGLLNVSVMKYGKRYATWICTQYLSATGGKPGDHWTRTLEHLLDHTWNGGFNLSSEHHEGASWYSKYKSDKAITPVENWQANSAKDDAFGLKVEWKPAGTVGEIMDAILTENGGAAAKETVANRIIKFAKV